MRVLWLEGAESDLKSIYEYIAAENPSAAVFVVQTIYEKGSNLEQFPEMGKVGKVEGTRELIIADLPYMIPYRIMGETVEILRVLHTPRKFPNL